MVETHGSEILNAIFEEFVKICQGENNRVSGSNAAHLVSRRIDRKAARALF